MTTMTVRDQKNLFPELVDADSVGGEAIVVDQTYWGYIIHRANQEVTQREIFMNACGVAGIAFIVAALGMWLLPGTAVGTDAFVMKLALSGVVAAVGIQLFWYSGRGGLSEVHVDTKLGEFRQVARSRMGKVTPLGRYGFSEIGGVFLDRSVGGKGKSALLLRYRNTPKVVQVAIGPTALLEKLRDRIGQDILVHRGKVQPNLS